MYFLAKLKRLMASRFAHLRWYTIAIMVLLYAVIAWVMLYLCDETALIQLPDYVYWLIVTASTVGYGDLSPSSEAGKWLTSLFIIPVGLALFAMTVGRLATIISYQWQKGVKGLVSVDVQSHILVIGWNSDRTIQLLKLLLRERTYAQEKSPIVLCVDIAMENPLPNQIEFVRVGDYRDLSELSKANYSEAKSIIIDDDSDEATLAIALFCQLHNAQAHIIAYFNDERLSDILKQHCPNVECTPSVAVEMLAKSAVDPGSSALHHELLNVDSGQTQYSVRIPKNLIGKPIGPLFQGLKGAYDATLIGIKSGSSNSIVLNPALDQPIESDATLFYIADERINQIEWQNFYVQ